MNKVYFSLGSNKGNKEKNLYQAITYIREFIGSVKDFSSIYETEPAGFISSDNFYNMVLFVETEQNAEEVLNKALQIESCMGRIRTLATGYESRVIDVDLLFFNDQVINTESLVVPHKKILERNFILFPLSEIAADVIHPVYNKTVDELTRICEDKNFITLFKHKKRLYFYGL
jgi:2-amino-4-hydroxy-6-hydroxymethyldihydropteridine diphosphokinase